MNSSIRKRRTKLLSSVAGWFSFVLINARQRLSFWHDRLWIFQNWIDYSLRWKPEDYGNIHTIQIPSTRVWTPDIFLYNRLDPLKTNSFRLKIRWIFIFKRRWELSRHNKTESRFTIERQHSFCSSCDFEIDLSVQYLNISIREFSLGNSADWKFYYCFFFYRIFLDIQNCTLKFGSWTHDESGRKLRFSLKSWIEK